MARSSGFRLSALLALLAMLMPMAALADSCADCLWAASPDCCPTSCCPCCVQVPSTLAAVHAADPGLPAGSLAEVAPGLHASPDPRDVLHVPKTSRA